MNNLTFQNIIGLGGPNPFIYNVTGNKYNLKNNNVKYLLFSNDDNVNIYVECVKTNKKDIKKILKRYIDNKSKKVTIYNRILNNEVYMKYLYINDNKNTIVIDMDTLEIIKNNKLKNINIGKIKLSPNGLFINNKFVVNQRNLERNIIINENENNNQIKIVIMRDKRNVINRNSIYMEIQNFNNIFNYTGLFIRESKFYNELISNPNMLLSNVGI